MEEPPQEIVEQVSVSPGADMVFQDKAPRSQDVICQIFFKRLRDSAKRLEEPPPWSGSNKGRIIRLYLIKSSVVFDNTVTVGQRSFL
jgi:hypothetical protein